MGLGKKDIVKNISSKTLFSLGQSLIFLDTFLSFIKRNKTNTVKISNFGTFSIHTSPARIGRNPKTKEEFQINPIEKLSFKTSQKVRSKLN
jgi:integration host factor subunit alpha